MSLARSRTTSRGQSSLDSHPGTARDRCGRCHLASAFVSRPRRTRRSSSRNQPLSEITRIHLIGICGTAMATLAALLKRRGFDVRGSDQSVYPPMSDFLAAEGIPALSGYRAEHITGDLEMVVVGNAISRGNPELEEVLDRKIRYGSLPEAVRDH